MNQKEFMEKNSLSNSLKDHSLVNSRACNKHCNNNNNNNNNSDDGKNKLKDSWNHSSQSHGGGDYLSKKSHGEDYLGGISWPPRSYTCSFCKREFRSAQALGGHMNVHRRDRARLRQSPPPRDGQFPLLNLNLCPNPNPNFSSPSFTSTLPALVSPSLSALSSAPFASSSENKKRDVADPQKSSPHPKRSGLTKMETRKSLSDVEEFEGFTDNDGCKFLKNAEIVSLDLEIGLFSDAKEDLDLELRLGYS